MLVTVALLLPFASPPSSFEFGFNKKGLSLILRSRDEDQLREHNHQNETKLYGSSYLYGKICVGVQKSELLLQQ